MTHMRRARADVSRSAATACYAALATQPTLPRRDGHSGIESVPYDISWPVVFKCISGIRSKNVRGVIGHKGQELHDRLALRASEQGVFRHYSVPHIPWIG